MGTTAARRSGTGWARRVSLVALPVLLCAVSTPAHATTLTFEVFDSTLDALPYNDPTVPPTASGYGYLEGFGIPGAYGDNVNSTSQTIGTELYRYGVGAEGFTPNVSAVYGPSSIFTGGPNLWRGGYGDLNGVLYQGSNGPVGTDYDVLDVVLYADAGYDVTLYGFDLAAAGFQSGFVGDLTVNSVSIFDGVPFPFLTPTNFLTSQQTNVVVSSTGHNSITFSSPLQAPVIWLHIDANNLGASSQGIGVDNLRFGQIASNNPGIDPALIDEALQASPTPVPEPTTLALVGGGLLAAIRRRRASRRG